MAATTSKALECVDFLVDGPVAVLTFRREEQLNAYSLQMLEEIEQALSQAEARPGIRVLVLRGSRASFCTGADLDEVMPLIKMGDATLFRKSWLEHAHRVATRLEQSRLIVVAAVEGFALAGGLELALAADLIIAAEDARLGDQHLAFDLIPGGGASQRLARAIGAQRAKLLLYTSRWITGRDAERIGLVAKAVPADEFDAAIEEIVGLIARRGPQALERTKGLVNEGLGIGLEAGLAREREVAAVHMVSEEARTGLDRFYARKSR